MEVARYKTLEGDEKAVLFENEAFTVDGSPLTVQTLSAWSTAGQLEWASDETRDWFSNYATWSTRVSAPARRALPVPAKALLVVAALGIAGLCGIAALGAMAGSPSEAPKNQPAASASTPVVQPEETATAVSAAVSQAPVIVAREARVSRIVDGDTIEVTFPDGSVEKVRFIGVDSPEATTKTEPYGAEATKYCASALDGKTVLIETDAGQRDNYGRLLAHVWLSMPIAVSEAEVRAKLFNARIVLDGYASLMTIPPNVKYVDFLKSYEGEARTAQKGLWTPPPPTPAPAPPAVAAEEPASDPIVSSYVGNSNTRKFHDSGCRYVSTIKPSNRVNLSSRSKAVSSGYVPCKVCSP